jgi:hypothetical protein
MDMLQMLGAGCIFNLMNISTEQFQLHAFLKAFNQGLRLLY